MTTQNDAKQREFAITDIAHSYIVDAGAGTGKTSVLVERIMSIIRETDTMLTEIAAITFTEKAAGELKFRLRQEIDKAVAAAKDAGEAGKRIDRLTRALSDIESASIGTIHSFCSSLLKERPAEAGVDPGFNVADEFQAGLMFDDVWAQWIEEQILARAAPLERALRMGMRIDALGELAHALADNHDFVTKIPIPGKYPSVKELVKHLKPMEALLIENITYCRKEDDTLFIDIDNFRRWLAEINANADPVEAWLYAGSLNLKCKGNKSNWKPADKRDETQTILKGAIEKISEFSARISAALADEVVGWLCGENGFTRRFEEAKDKLGLLDFQDLLLKARDLLKIDKHVRKYYQDRYKYLLVDEFQDTDPLQVEIVFYITEANPVADNWKNCETRQGKLFIVGDPKQSIYAFRRADIQTYSRVKSMVESAGRASLLSKNFRTVAPIINWVNERFDFLMGPGESDFQPAYKAIEPNRIVEEPDIKTGPWILPVPAGKSGNARDTREIEARTIAAFLKDVVERKWRVFDKATKVWRDIAYKDIAMLFLTRTDIDIFENALKALEIQYVTPGGKTFYETLEIAGLLSCLRAIDRPDDPVAMVGALRSPFFGFSDEEIFLANREGLKLDYLEPIPAGPRSSLFGNTYSLLKEMHGKRNAGRMAALIEEFYALTMAPALFMMKPPAEQRLANLFKVVERARAFENAGPRTFGEFIDNLQSAEDRSGGEQEAPAVEEGNDFVRLMTIHGAKGLEFPMVVIANMSLKPKSGATMIYDRNTGRIEFDIGPLQTESWVDASEANDKRSRAEYTRLLYVACTRARDYLVLPTPENGAPAGYTEPLLRSLGLANPAPVNVFPTERLIMAENEGKPFTFRATPKVGKKTEKELERFVKWRNDISDQIERLKRPGLFRTVTSMVKKDADFPAGASVGLKMGSFFHDLMDAIGFEDDVDVEGVAACLSSESTLNDAQIAECVRMAKSAMTTDSWRRAKRASRSRKEYPFILNAAEGIESGRPDLVFIEDGGLVIVDYKTDKVENAADAEKRMQSGHREQIRHYASALEKITGLDVKEGIVLFVKPDPPMEVR